MIENEFTEKEIKMIIIYDLLSSIYEKNITEH